MQPFQFNSVPSLTVEWGGAAQLGDKLKAWFAERRLLVVTDRGLRGAGVLDPALASLGAAGFNVTLYDAVVADPPESVLLDCVALARAAEVDIVVGFGGGSSMDVAKLAAVLIRSTQSLASLYGIAKVEGDRLPLVQVPTTAGTGSEVTNITILTTGETTKMGVVADQLYADRVLLDGALTTGLPPIHTAATGIDAMVHAIEAFTSRHKKNPISDIFCREALRLLSTHLVTACRSGGDRPAREALLLGATLAGQAFANAPVAAVHALAYPLGGHCHLPHGLANALMLGPVLEFNLKAATPLYAQLATPVGVELTGSDETLARGFIEHMKQLMDATGAPRRLRDVGVAEALLPTLAADAMLQTRLLANNPVPLTEGDALALYRAAY